MENSQVMLRKHHDLYQQTVMYFYDFEHCEKNCDTSGTKFTILWDMEILVLNKFYSDCCEDIARQSCEMVPTAQMATFLAFFACCIFSEPRAARFRPAF